jgi:hypothetical protein
MPGHVRLAENGPSELHKRTEKGGVFGGAMPEGEVEGHGIREEHEPCHNGEPSEGATRTMQHGTEEPNLQREKNGAALDACR